MDPDEITEEVMASHLYTAGIVDPDLVIRTAGEMRVQQFSAVADQLCRVVGDRNVLARLSSHRADPGAADFARRDRRFGGLKD